ncbi:hypothetical protein [Flavivirga jejuensis]|uniref:Uncharacterized protein n=1 Tax=Flavivirga jejuensis TaxID=870487 RepID=A0ABT8WPB5_9FLAO|nr:hypothetical protein [Flavivirga jejuensis]MDO5974860.1 hypothetical protein [Flavivirga jejuensis]
MKEAKEFVENFFELEANVFMKKKRKSLQNYLDGVEDLKQLALGSLIRELGFMFLVQESMSSTERKRYYLAYQDTYSR